MTDIAITEKRPLLGKLGLDRLPGAQSIGWPLAAIAIALVLQVELVFSKSINWDEFFHFSEIHQQLLGRSDRLFQVPFVYLFSWVTSLPGDTISHIQIIRALILPFEVVTLACIFAGARRFASKETALVCALAYVTGGYIFLHAFALRADMIAAALLSAALWLFLCKSLRPITVLAIVLLSALAFVATIKAVLFAPAFIGVALLRLKTNRQRMAFAGLLACGAIAGVALLLLGPHLPETGASGILQKLALLGNSSVDRMISGGLFPQGSFLLAQILIAPLLAAIICVQVILLFKGGRTATERVALACLLLPLASVAVYRNAFPYFFVFIMPPALIAAAPAVQLILKRYGLAAASMMLLANAALLSVVEDRSVLERQVAVQTGVREVFPNPVVYIDESGMIGDYPRAINHFASGWGLADYRSTGTPTYSQALQQEQIPFLLANSRSLIQTYADIESGERLLPEDERTLRANYIEHWGLLRVAGKVIPAGPQPMSIDFAVPGTYTVEGGAIELDGKRLIEGQTVTLDRGNHRIGAMRANEVTLRWGDHLPKPTFDWPEGRIFTIY